MATVTSFPITTVPLSPLVGIKLDYSSTTTDADPGDGVFRLNNATVASATAAYIDNTDSGGRTISGLLDLMDDSTSTIRGALRFENVNDQTIWAEFQVTGSVVDGTGYRKLTLQNGVSAGTFSDGDEFAIAFYAKGDSGSASGLVTVSGVSSYSVLANNVGKLHVVDTYGPPSVDPVTVTMPSSGVDEGGEYSFTKAVGNIHPGNVIIRGALRATTTATKTASASTFTVADATGIAVGQAITGTGIPRGATVLSIVGTTVTMSFGFVCTATSTDAVTFHDGIAGVKERQYEIHGEALTIVWDGLSQWHLKGVSLYHHDGSWFKGHHTVGSPYSVASPYDIDGSTANGQMFDFVPTSAGTSIKANMPVPSTIVQGYNPANMVTKRDDGGTDLALFYTPSATWDQSNSPVYPFVLEDYGDVRGIYTSGDEYRTLWEFDAHESWINNLSLSSTSSVRVGNDCAASATIYLVPNQGDHISLPSTTANTAQRWFKRRVRSAISHAISSSTYGYAGVASNTHNAYAFIASDGSVQLFLGAGNAGASEYTLLDGVRVNASALAGSVAAKAARWVGTVTLDGSAQVIYISDGLVAPPQLNGNVGINTAPAGTENSTLRIYRNPAGGAFSQLEMGGSGVQGFYVTANASGVTIKNASAGPLVFGTDNTDRFTLSSAGGFYSAGVTGGDPGAGKINAAGLQVSGNNVVTTATTKPTRQVFTSGSGTYTKPAGVTWIEVELVGGGGGGAGSGTTAGAGGSGGNTTFSTLTANGGAGGTSPAASGGAGGTATGGDDNQTGGVGEGGSGSAGVRSGNGGHSKRFGGTPAPAFNGNAGLSAPTNSGAGGSGASSSSGAQGGGGGGGGWLSKIITSPSATYSYAVGAAGTAGTAGSGASALAGGAGGSGIIIVTEHYGS